MHIGYARVSTTDQQVHLQRDALTHAGCQSVLFERSLIAERSHVSLHPSIM